MALEHEPSVFEGDESLVVAVGHLALEDQRRGELTAVGVVPQSSHPTFDEENGDPLAHDSRDHVVEIAALVDEASQESKNQTRRADPDPLDGDAADRRRSPLGVAASLRRHGAA